MKLAALWSVAALSSFPGGRKGSFAAAFTPLAGPGRRPATARTPPRPAFRLHERRERDGAKLPDDFVGERGYALPAAGFLSALLPFPQEASAIDIEGGILGVALGLAPILLAAAAAGFAGLSFLNNVNARKEAEREQRLMEEAIRREKERPFIDPNDLLGSFERSIVLKTLVFLAVTFGILLFPILIVSAPFIIDFATEKVLPLLPPPPKVELTVPKLEVPKLEVPSSLKVGDLLKGASEGEKPAPSGEAPPPAEGGDASAAPSEEGKAYGAEATPAAEGDKAVGAETKPAAAEDKPAAEAKPAAEGDKAPAAEAKPSAEGDKAPAAEAPPAEKK